MTDRLTQPLNLFHPKTKYVTEYLVITCLVAVPQKAEVEPLPIGRYSTDHPPEAAVARQRRYGQRQRASGASAGITAEGTGASPVSRKKKSTVAGNTKLRIGKTHLGIRSVEVAAGARNT